VSTRDERPPTGDRVPYRGQYLGLPAEGPGSVAGFGIRLLALAIDWALANLVALMLAGTGVWSAATARVWLPLVAWYLLTSLATGLTGASIGQWALRLRVLRLDRRPVGLLRGFARTALIALVLPAVVSVGEGRGLHDLAVGTVVVHGPR
jgi:uncharacterized RDD family membrane protein YckC